MTGSNRSRTLVRVLCLAVLGLTLMAGALPRAGAASPPPSPAVAGGWRSTGGPWDASGDARLFAVDAETEQTLSVVEAAGITTLYGTADGGATWLPLWTINRSLSALNVRGEVLYTAPAGAAPGEPAILRSEDGGVTWTGVLTATDFTTVNFFDRAPAPSTAVYAAATIGGSGVVLFSPEGLVWETLFSISGQMVRVGVDPANPSLVFSGGQSGNAAEVYRSVNGGSDWSVVLSVAGEGIQDFIQVHPLAPGRVFVTTRPPNCCPPDPANLWRSDDGGDTWTVVSTGYLYNLYFAPPDSIYSIYDAVSVTHDASSPQPTWINRGVPFSEWVHGRAVDARPAEPVIYAGLPISGIYTSTDDGQTFQSSNNGVRSLLEAHALAPDPQDPDSLFAATDKGVFRSDDSGDTWSSTFPRMIARDVAIRPGNSPLLLATVEDRSIVWPVPSPLLYRSEDGGESWSLTYSQSDDPGMTHGAFGVAFDPSDPDTVFASTCAWTPGDESNNHLLRSLDGGLTWEDILFTRGQAPGVVVIEVALDGTVYFGGKEGFMGDGRAILYRSDDHGSEWAEVYTHDSGWRVISLSIDPQTPAELAMIVSEMDGSTHLLQSHDRGDTWEEAGGEGAPALGPAAGLTVVAHDPIAAGRLFLGATGPAVLVSDDNGQTWFEVGGWSDPFRASQVSALAAGYAPDERVLYTGLGGSGLTGVWRRDLLWRTVLLPLVMRLSEP